MLSAARPLQDAPDPAAEHVTTLLRVLNFGADAVPAEEGELYLVREEDDAFWELLGFRIRGCPGILLAAVRFQRQPRTQQKHARSSLIHHLSHLPRETGGSASEHAPRMLAVLLPEPAEDIPTFQRRVRDGNHARRAYVDVDSVELAFDFRVENPSVHREQNPNLLPPERHLFRTTQGHLLSGTAFGVHGKLRRREEFLAIRDPEQHTPRASQTLPTVALRCGMIAMVADLAAAETVDQWLARTAPFLRESASSSHLLLPS